METVANYLRDIHRAAIAADKGLDVQEVRIYFDAPKSSKISLKDVKDKDAFFQWGVYSILFKDAKGDDYLYRVNLNGWGTKQETAMVYVSDDRGGIDEKKEVDDITPQDVESSFPPLFKDGEPDLIPPKEFRVNYVNENGGRIYSQEAFKGTFDDSFYPVVQDPAAKGGVVVNPFGDDISIKGAPPGPLKAFLI